MMSLCMCVISLPSECAPVYDVIVYVYDVIVYVYDVIVYVYDVIVYVYDVIKCACM